MAGVVSSLRYLLADVIGDDDAATPLLPEGLPDAVVPVVSDGIHRLIDYQGPSYAQLYVDRSRRFVGRSGVDDAMFGEIARLMAIRMSYDDPIRIAQLKLGELKNFWHFLSLRALAHEFDWVAISPLVPHRVMKDCAHQVPNLRFRAFCPLDAIQPFFNGDWLHLV